MGQGPSHGAAPPWVPAHGSRYPPDIEDKIMALAESPDTFLKPAEGDTLPEPFVIENHYDEIEAALQYDDRLAEQLETLVPKQIAESDFWRNYFSRVVVLRAEGQRALDKEKAAAEALAAKSKPRSPSPRPVAPVAAPPPDLEHSLPEIVAKARVSVPDSRVRWGVAGDNIALPRSVQIDVAHEFPNVDIVFIGERLGIDEQVRLGRAVAAAGKPCVMRSARAAMACLGLGRQFRAAHAPLLATVLSDSVLPRWAIVRALVETGHLGHVETVSHRLVTAGSFEWHGANALIALDRVFGPLQCVSGHARRLPGSTGPETAVAATFTTRNGAVGALVHRFCDDDDVVDELVIEGTRGRIVMPVEGDGSVHFFAQGSKEPIQVDSKLGTPKAKSSEDLLLGIIASGSSDQLFQLSAALSRSAKLVDVVLRSFYGDRHDHFWTRPDTWGRC
ncbi:BSD domain-containing protein [Plasmodiophora brassicae]|uniref:BSD domain-containing protein n=1 Tax=Plasmodiophora brassicae TaxID=37360 RepID=A0A3P3XZN4_PLABS|nr:unnamed protein product [Plasmodiophora brassicae]